jgi:hypothetical protein
MVANHVVKLPYTTLVELMLNVAHSKTVPNCRRHAPSERAGRTRKGMHRVQGYDLPVV